MNCLPIVAHAVTIDNGNVSQLEKTKANINAEILNNEFNLEEFMQTHKNVEEIVNIDRKVIFDYTDNDHILKQSLSKPTDVYCEEIKIRYKTINSKEHEEFTMKSTRSFGGNSITFISTLYCDVITDFYDAERNKYIDIYFARLASIKSSSKYDNAWVATLDLNITQFGWDYHIEDLYYKNSEDESYTYLQNDGIYETIYNSEEGYVCLDSDYASCVATRAEMLVIWKTGPGHTEGEEYNIENTKGPGHPY